MISTVKHFLKSIIPHSIHEWRAYKQWERDGSPVPPPHSIKQMVINSYQKKYGCSIFVETGTYLGDMVKAQKNRFKKVFSLELSEELYEQAKTKFNNDAHIMLLQGDSSEVLPKVMSQIFEPAIFWLDGHYSAGITARGAKDCPILEELDAIFSGKPLNHIILIDDARDFIGRKDYPTIKELENHISNKDIKFNMKVEKDIIQIVIV